MQIKPRKLNTHKGDYGHVFVLAGSLGMSGAACLTSLASLLSGSGLVTLGVPKSLNPIMEIKLTEVMTKPLAETKELSLSLKSFTQIRKVLPKIDALAIGPGLSRNSQTQELVRKLLLILKKPTVLDADGVNALKGHLNIINKFKSELVLTPHPGEMSKMLNLSVPEIQKKRRKIATDFTKRYNATLVLKGHQTIVAEKHQIYINRTGNPGMASAGCGDVLTGIIAAFLGQGMDAFQAAKSAVYFHGLAGDYAAKEKGEISLIASDLLDKLPHAFKSGV